MGLIRGARVSKPLSLGPWDRVLPRQWIREREGREGRLGLTHLARRASCRSLGQTHWSQPLPKMVSAMLGAPGHGGESHLRCEEEKERTRHRLGCRRQTGSPRLQTVAPPTPPQMIPTLVPGIAPSESLLQLNKLLFQKTPNSGRGSWVGDAAM